MGSCSDYCRVAERAYVDELSVEDRVVLALELGERAVELYRAYKGVDTEIAVRELRVNAQLGRRLSRCAAM